MKNERTPRTLAESSFQTGYPTMSLFYTSRPWWVRLLYLLRGR